MAKRGSLYAYFSFQSGTPAAKKPKLNSAEQTNHLIHSEKGIGPSARLDEHVHVEDEGQDHKVKIHEKLLSIHWTYPQPVEPLPKSYCSSALTRAKDEPNSSISKIRLLNNAPDLDCVYYEQFFSRNEAGELFDFLRAGLFYYKVKYKIKRGPSEVDINTPRYTTVFGVDDSAKFKPKYNSANSASSEPDQATSELELVDAKSEQGIAWKSRYKQAPRPIPDCLLALLQTTESITGCSFNFCLVNYYASGQHSISYHSDDESFLGPNPAIASFSLGATRDFCLRHKSASDPKKAEGETIKIPLNSGDMILMRGSTQKHWLHSIPKRSDRNKAPGKDSGRINITFRKAVTRGGTDNYYRYNVGEGPAYRWDRKKECMEIIGFT